MMVFTIISWLFTWLILSVEAAYAFYWIFGTWLPWFADAALGLVPITAPVWLILWLLHFVPSIAWPLVK